MKDEEYVSGVLKTEAPVDVDMLNRISNHVLVRLSHGVDGLVTEAGELKDVLKRHIYYGAQLDIANIIEECGDVFYYLGIISNVLGISFEEIKRRNHEKLKARYGEKFSKNRALNRDLVKERKIVEGND